MADEDKLWNYFREVNDAVEAANQGKGSQPFRRGTFIVTALSGDVELSVKDVSEEDAILIVAELESMGIKANLQASVICPNCKQRVPKQSYCIQCRTKLTDEADK
ncbi:MAG: hypothetical protein KC422_20535 [Trueperaceae bacterium]|nr:hypothetical protein [Trueperaceae bacterium]